MVLYAVLGVIVGAVVTLTAAVLVARGRIAATAAKAGAALAERQRAADVLQITVREQATRIRDLEVQLREIDTVRSTRTALSTELERARQDLATAIKAEAEARETARLAEERLQSESMVGRRTAAADRAVQDAQLRAAQQMAESLRGALAAERDSAARARHALEAERDRMRASYESELVTARAALRRVEAEWVGLQTELAEARHDIEVRSRDLESERRNAAAVEAALRSGVGRGSRRAPRCGGGAGGTHTRARGVPRPGAGVGTGRASAPGGRRRAHRGRAPSRDGSRESDLVVRFTGTGIGTIAAIATVVSSDRYS